MTDIAEKVASDAYAKMLGITIDKVSDNYASCSIIITEAMINFLGVVHGGLIFSLADVAFSAAGNSTHMPSYALDISGSFLRTAQVGDLIRAEADLIHSTRRTGVYRMRVFHEQDLLATFIGTVFRK